MNLKSLIAAIIFSTSVGCSDSAGKIKAIEASSKVLNPTTAESRTVVKLTDAAVVKLKEYLAGDAQRYLRISIVGDGTSGFTYDLQIEDGDIRATDYIDTTHGFAVVIDQKSLRYLDGATIDWGNRPDGREGFEFDNPNATKEKPGE